jgi:phage-related protein
VNGNSAPTRMKPLEFLGSSRDDYRAIYVAKFEAAVYVLHAFQKKSQQTAKVDIEFAKARYRTIGGKS